MLSRLLSLSFLATACATSLERIARDECKPCNPQGATGTTPPAVGSDLDSLYLEVLQSVKDIHFRKRWSDSIEKRADGFCCAESLDCVNVQGPNIPVCYDKFTTNYAFPDGSWGSLTTGEYNGKDGAKANLLSGEYTKSGGETGDIYSKDPGAKPNTATLSIPPQFTGTGVGSAIPASEIASLIIMTITISGTTIATPTVIPGSTIFATVSGQTLPVSTVPEQTITSPITIPAVTSVMTRTQSTAVASSSSTGAATQASAKPNASFGMSVLTALIYAIYS